jgi:phage terminase large subunit
VLVRCYIVGRVLYVDYEVWQVGCEIDKTPALFERVPESNRWPITADSSNPQSISYMQRNGYTRIEASVKGVGSVDEGIEFLKSYDIVVHPRCRHVVDEMSSYSYEIDKQTEEVLPKLADKKNHTIDSLRYAVEAVRRSNYDSTMAWVGGPSVDEKKAVGDVRGSWRGRVP